MSRWTVSQTLTVGVTGNVTIHGWGGGGGSRTNVAATAPGAGGGAYSRKNSAATTAGSTQIAMTIGAAGVGNSTASVAGGDTTVTISAVTQILAKGGGIQTGGAAASGTGDQKYSGGMGGNSASYFDSDLGGNVYASGGGGGAGGQAADGSAGTSGSGDMGTGPIDGQSGSGGGGYFPGGFGGSGFPGGGGVGLGSTGGAGAVELEWSGMPRVVRRGMWIGSTSDATSWVLTSPPNYPSLQLDVAIASGEQVRWVLAIVSDGNPTLTESGGNGWTKEGQQSQGTAVTLAIFTKETTTAFATSDYMPPFTLSSTASEQFNAIFLAYRATTGKVAKVVTPTFAAGASTNSDPPSITNNTGASRQCYCIAIRGGDAQVNATVSPAGYGQNTALIGQTSLGASIGWAEVEKTIANSGTENPGTFTSATEDWVCATLLLYEETPAPVITPSTSAFNVAENVAFSQDFNADQAVTWSLVGGTDQAKFSIDANGLLSLPAKDYDVPDDSNADRIYVVTLRATATVGGLTTDKTVTVTVTSDVTAPTITPATTAFTIASGQAFSQDFNSGETVTWSIVGGADAGLFSINSAGLLSMSAKDFYTPQDSGGNNVYDVTFRATDLEGLTTDRSVTVTVTAPTFYPTSATADNTGTAVLSWTNTANLYADDETEAAHTNLANSQYTDTITLTGYDLSSIPDGATILGIEVIAEISGDRSSGSMTHQFEFKVKTSAAKVTGYVIGRDFAEAVYTLGGPTDMWGLSGADLTGAGLKSSFDVKMLARAAASGSGSGTYDVDYVAVRIYYNPAVNLTATSLATGSPANGTPAIGQKHLVAATSLATASPALGTPALAHIHVLTATGTAPSSPALGTPAIGQKHLVTATAVATGSPAIGSPAFTQKHAFTPAMLTFSMGSPVIGSPAMAVVSNLVATPPPIGSPGITVPAFTQRHAFTTTGVTTASPANGSPAITQKHALVASNLAPASPALGSPVFTQRQVLTANNLATGPPALGSPALGVVRNLVANSLAPASPVLPSPSLGVLLTELITVHPGSVVSAGGWTDNLGGNAIPEAVDEVVANDTDYGKSEGNPVDDVLHLKFADFAAVSINRDVMLRYRLGRTGMGGDMATVTLYQGSTLIGGPWVHNDLSSLVTYEQAINAALITDGADLYLKVEAD